MTRVGIQNKVRLKPLGLEPNRTILEIYYVTETDYHVFEGTPVMLTIRDMIGGACNWEGDYSMKHNIEPGHLPPRRYTIADNLHGLAEYKTDERWLVLDTVDNKYVIKTNMFNNAIKYLARMNQKVITPKEAARRVRFMKFKRSKESYGG